MPPRGPCTGTCGSKCSLPLSTAEGKEEQESGRGSRMGAEWQQTAPLSTGLHQACPKPKMTGREVLIPPSHIWGTSDPLKTLQVFPTGRNSMSAVKAETTSVSAHDCQPQDQQVFIEHLLCARPCSRMWGWGWGCTKYRPWCRTLETGKRQILKSRLWPVRG